MIRTESQEAGSPGPSGDIIDSCDRNAAPTLRRRLEFHMRQSLLPLSLAGALCAMAVMAATTPAPPNAPPAEAKSGETNAPGAPPTVIAEQPRHETISKVMTSLVERSHYSRVKVD